LTKQSISSEQSQETISRMPILTNTSASENFFDTEKKLLKEVHMVSIPPYDERLDIHMEEFYKKHWRYP
jgi:hypothetical protein